MNATTIIYKMNDKLLLTYDRFSDMSGNYISSKLLEELSLDTKRNVLIVDIKENTDN